MQYDYSSITSVVIFNYIELFNWNHKTNGITIIIAAPKIFDPTFTEVIIKKHRLTNTLIVIPKL